jgi:hypothetical protein
MNLRKQKIRRSRWEVLGSQQIPKLQIFKSPRGTQEAQACRKPLKSLLFLKIKRISKLLCKK